jgi:hypothetical protein
MWYLKISKFCAGITVFNFVTGEAVRCSGVITFTFRDVPAIDTLYGLFDIPLLLSAWLAVTFATVVISLPHVLYTIYHQEVNYYDCLCSSCMYIFYFIFILYFILKLPSLKLFQMHLVTYQRFRLRGGGVLTNSIV